MDRFRIGRLPPGSMARDQVANYLVDRYLRSGLPPGFLGGDGRGPNLLVDGDMEAVGVAAWSVLDCTVAKQTTDPYEGTQYLRCTRTAATYGTLVNVLVSGRVYRVTGANRCSAAAGETPLVYNSNVLPVGLISPSTEWTLFDFTFTAATNGFIYFWDPAGGAGAWTGWDALYLSEVT